MLLPPAGDAVRDGDTVVLNRARPLELTVDGVSRQVYVTALSVDEALGQLGYRAEGLVLSASRSERLPLQGMELTITTPKEIVLVADGQQRVVTTTAATAGDLLAEQGIALEPDRQDEPLPEPGPAEPHAAAGLPRAGQRGLRDDAVPADKVETPNPDAFVGERNVTTPGVDGQKVTRYRVTVVDGVETGREASTGGHRPAGHRAGHRRHQAEADRRADRRRPQLGRAGQVRVRRQPPGRQPGRLLRALPVLAEHLEVGRRLGQPDRRLAGRADRPRADAVQARPAPASGAAAATCSTDRTHLSTPPEQSDGLLGPAAIRELAQQLDLRPTKTLGQNFLHDANTIRRIVRTAELGPDDVVLEVGPGLGSLTLGLLPAVARVVAVEIDPRLADRLPVTVAERRPDLADRLTVVTADALRIQELPGPPPTALVANLPYNIAVPVLLQPAGAAADAGPGTGAGPGRGRRAAGGTARAAAYGVPSVKAAWYGEVRRAGNVGRRVFWPEPNVDSGLVSLVRRPPPPGDRRATFAAVDAAFATRRKGLRAALAPWAGSPAAAEARLRAAGIDPATRGEQLSVTDFARLAATDAGASREAVVARAPAKVNVHLAVGPAAAGRLPRAADGLPRGVAVRHGHRPAGEGLR